MSLLRRFIWRLQSRRKEAQVREELQFHLEQEIRERHEAGLPDNEARWSAHRDLGNEARVREEVRSVWSWRPVDELLQDLRYAFRTLFKSRAVTIVATLSLALGIGASTAIYCFMEAALLRRLPAVSDPASLVVIEWRSKPFNYGRAAVHGPEFVLRAIDGSFYQDASGVTGRIFPYPAFEQLQRASAPVLGSLFAFRAAKMTVLIDRTAEFADVQYVTGDFFRGLAVAPAAGRLLVADDDRDGAASVAVITSGFGQRHFGETSDAIGRSILINNVPFTIAGVTPSGFHGVDPGARPTVFLPMRASLMLDSDAQRRYTDPNYYWATVMGRLRPTATRAQAEAVLAPAFGQWVAPTATNERERANLPLLRVTDGAAGLDTLRRRYSNPLYLLLAVVALILAIACANTANLLLARATARRREIAVRLSIGAGRFRLIRQLLTESLVLSAVSGGLGILLGIAGMRVLTVLLANGADAFTIDPEWNWRVVAVAAVLSMSCGVLFGLVPAIQSTRPALVPALKDRGDGDSTRHRRGATPPWSVMDVLVVTQITILLLLLTAASLFVRTLSNLQSIQLGFNGDNVLLFELNARQAGLPEPMLAGFYDDLRRRLADIPGVRGVTLSHASLIKAGRSYTLSIDGAPVPYSRVLQTGPGFFTTMQIAMLQGREIDDRDREGSAPVAVISDLFARNYFPGQNPIGRRVTFGSRNKDPLDLEIVGVATTVRYGGLKSEVPPVVYVPYAQIQPRFLADMTYALRIDGDPLNAAAAVREVVRQADPRVPVHNVTTQSAQIDQTIHQEIVLASLCTVFAVVALIIACVGLYGTMAYSVARRTKEIGIRVALGARRGAVVWMVMRRICMLVLIGVTISVPIARGASRFVESFLFEMTPGDPRALAAALAALLAVALAASYGPARRATRIDPMTALREE
jgi:predicted permease